MAQLSYSLALQDSCFNTFLFFSGISSSDSFSGSESLCTAENFTPAKWLTLGRTDVEDPPHCPLVGEYTGIIPDAEGLCARSYADCNNPEVMFYTVYNCGNASEVYEEREYRCFGQWREPSTGLVYTYTERRDIPGKECFVGVTLDDDDRHMVTEAGANCERGHQPEQYGMTLMRQSKCNKPVPSPVSTPRPNVPKNRIPYPPVSTERPVSPRLSTVRSVVIDGVEQFLEKVEAEEEQRYYEQEQKNLPGQQQNNNRGRKHHHKKHGHNNHRINQEDIATNEIPGSSRSPQPDSAAGITCNTLLFATLVLFSLLM